MTSTIARGWLIATPRRDSSLDRCVLEQTNASSFAGRSIGRVAAPSPTLAPEAPVGRVGSEEPVVPVLRAGPADRAALEEPVDPVVQVVPVDRAVSEEPVAPADQAVSEEPVVPVVPEAATCSVGQRVPGPAPEAAVALCPASTVASR